MEKVNISQVIFLGDSLSDRKTLYIRELLGLISMALLSGLKGKSPDGRFTNGLVWTDHFSAQLANKNIIKEFAAHYSPNLTPAQLSADLADEFITRSRSRAQLQYDLNDNLKVKYKDKIIVRSYTEGGLSSHSYRWHLSTSPQRFFSRMILSTLEEKRKLLLKDDKKSGVSDKAKEESLIVEWSGANDLITLNAKPSIKEADLAVKDRIKNVEKLASHGYKNFVLINLPDLSLTPRFHSAKYNDKDRENAHKVCKYFNQQLQSQVASLQKKYPQINVRVFDTDKLVEHAYTHPGEYGFDPEKQHRSVTEDNKDNGPKGGAHGYMFWDDVHPSADLHAIMADKFYRFFEKSFEHSVDPASSQVLPGRGRL